MKIAIATIAVILATSGAAQGDVRINTNWERCAYEDGSSQPRCVWDAKHQGNGEGQSVAIINGGEDNAQYINISHKRAKRLLGSNHTKE